ncbi:MAG: ATP-dependent RNA helicase HrpA, partial [Pseudomonadota bacterium]
MNADDPVQQLEALRARLDQVLAGERKELLRRWRGLARRAERDQPVDRGLPKLQAAIDASVAAREARSKPLELSFPEELPITAHVDEITAALATHPVVVVAGETGSGKTTQLPRICLAAGRGIDGLIGVTQPRRIAARSIAARVAEELGEKVGGTVGYEVRFDRRVAESTRVKIMTDGILLAETRRDADLRAYDTLIIDEAHERSLNIDFLIGYVKRLRQRRPDLRIVITSATIDTQRFAAHFDDAPIIEVSGRSYPVEMRYRPLAEKPEDDDRDLPVAIAEAVEELARHDPLGDVLVFLPGERDIRDVQEELEGRRWRETEVLPLFARLSPAEQQRIFHPGKARRIILSTNVAETSLTVPRIRFVVDSGLARISRYSHRSKVQRLPIEGVSRASADQRAGRCGRLGPGVCVRLYSEEDYAERPEFTEPEILRVNLATVILQMEALRLGRLQDFPFIDAPDERQVRDGYQHLHELGALTEDEQLAPMGRQLTRWPLDVRLARLVEAGAEHGCLDEAMTLAAALSIQDPRVRPLDARQRADEAHAQWQDPRSDFVAWLKLWRDYHETREDGSARQLRQWCQTCFLHFLRMREWSDVRRQLEETARELKLQRNEKPADYEAVHRAVVTAFL